MKLYVAILVGALGLLLLFAGVNGSIGQTWAALFGKGLPKDPNGPAANYYPGMPGSATGGTTGLPGNPQIVPSKLAGTGVGSYIAPTNGGLGGALGTLAGSSVTGPGAGLVLA